MGIASLYDILNRAPRTLAERSFAPWPDMEASLRLHKVPIFSLENRRSLAEFDVLGFSLSYELTYTNILNMLDLAGLPVRAADRTGNAPLVLAGGSGALVPEPLAPFVDAFVLGEGEEIVLEINDLLADWKRSGSDRTELLRALTRVQGVYVPSFYEWRYNIDGTVAEVFATDAGAPLPIIKRFLQGMPPVLTKPIVPFLQTVHDRAGIEIQRGCTQGCRFCQAGMIYRPLRERTPDEVVAAAKELFANTGYDELSLVSLSSTDHSQIKEIVQALRAEFGESITLSLPSTRVDSFSVDVALACASGKKRGMTFAPEAGSQRLRNAVSKVVADEDLLEAARNAFANGWTNIKLYFMVGLPTETLDDVQGIVDWAATSWLACLPRRWTMFRALSTGPPRLRPLVANTSESAPACASLPPTMSPKAPRSFPMGTAGDRRRASAQARAAPTGPVVKRGSTSAGTIPRSRFWKACSAEATADWLLSLRGPGGAVLALMPGANTTIPWPGTRPFAMWGLDPAFYCHRETRSLRALPVVPISPVA